MSDQDDIDFEAALEELETLVDVITSYSIHYTKLYENQGQRSRPKLARQATCRIRHLSSPAFEHAHITDMHDERMVRRSSLRNNFV